VTHTLHTISTIATLGAKKYWLGVTFYGIRTLHIN
jgi:hypothetical protein